MTLSGVIAIISRYYTEDLRHFKANCVKLVEAESMLSAKNVVPRI